jgi:hypothetical protein
LKRGRGAIFESGTQEIIMRAVRLEILAASTMRGLMALFVVYGGFAKAQHFSTPVTRATGDLAGYRYRAWGMPQTINGPVACGSSGPTCSGPLSASINNAGHAFVVFSTSDPQLTTFAIWVASE